jgi:hypothetical protein
VPGEAIRRPTRYGAIGGVFPGGEWTLADSLAESLLCVSVMSDFADALPGPIEPDDEERSGMHEETLSVRERRRNAGPKRASGFRGE